MEYRNENEYYISTWLAATLVLKLADLVLS